MNLLYQKLRKKSVLCIFIVIVVVPVSMQAMDSSTLMLLPKTSLGLFEQLTYPNTRQSLEFEYAHHLIDSGKDKQQGIDRLQSLASDQYPDVRAQVFLGLRAVAEKRRNDAEYFLGCASNWHHPVAQTELGKLVFTEDQERALSLLYAAAQPRELPCASRCYYHFPAIEFLASWYGDNDQVRYSEQSFYFAQLAAQVSGKQRWWKHLHQLRQEYETSVTLPSHESQAQHEHAEVTHDEPVPAVHKKPAKKEKNAAI